MKIIFPCTSSNIQHPICYKVGFAFQPDWKSSVSFAIHILKAYFQTCPPLRMVLYVSFGISHKVSLTQRDTSLVLTF